MEWKRIREKVLDRYATSEEELEETQKKYNQISDLINEEFGLETHFAGSASRGTCLSGDRDIDIFVLFPEDKSRTELEEEGLEVGKTVFEKFNEEYRIEYAEHPYTKGEINGHEVEIVPCYDVSPRNIKSSVDRTPHHSRWVDSNLNDEQRKDVVLLKAFLRAGDMYGSSLKTQGFSGYLCENLIAEYGGFKELVREAIDWNERQVIDPEEQHEGPLPDELRKKFSEDNLILIDPVDPERNVAAVLSRENYAKFIYRCWEFRQKPGMNFFEEQERPFTEFGLKQEIQDRADILVIEFETPEEVEDIVYPQMRKAVRRFNKLLKKHEFRIYEKGFHVGEEKTRLYFELDQELPGIQEVQGPKVFHGENHIAQFRTKYDNVYVEEDRVRAKVDREYTDAKNLLKDFLDSEDLKEKGIPETVAEQMERYSMADPLNEDKKWLKHLAEKFHVEDQK